MEMPKIGDKISTGQALELCRHFGLSHLVERIESNPNIFKPWIFDGCSMVPDELLGLFTGCDWKDITFKCCLPHDLKYAYGEPGNIKERKEADIFFHSDLIVKAKMDEWLANVFKIAVEIGGSEKFGLSFSWAFARK